MSRYTARIPKTTIQITWGYDVQLDEVFLEARDESLEDDDPDYTQFAIGTRVTLKKHPATSKHKHHYTHSEILEIIEKDNYDRVIPPEHLEAIKDRTPF